MLGLALWTTLAALPATALPDSSAVYGGETVEQCGWPSVVTIDDRCTGTLIHPELVLYAAHCGPASTIGFGETATAPARTVATESCAGFDQTAFAPGQDWAYCKLLTAVTDVPIVPVLSGCETTLVTPGREVEIVGFGLDENQQSGIKRAATTTLNFVAETGEVHVGGDGIDSCGGDSGGPIFVRLGDDVGGDGSWRVLAVTSRGPPCGLGGYNSLVHPALPWIETDSGVDVTPCTTAEGEWDPSPRCGGFPRSPDASTGTTWAEGCAGGLPTGLAATCGDPFVWPDDHAPPIVHIDSPIEGEAIELDGSFGTVDLAATVEELDSHVLEVRLDLAGPSTFADVAFTPPWSWPLELPEGEWTASVSAIDWAGNEGRTAIAFTVGLNDAESSSSGAPIDEAPRGCGCTTTNPHLAGLAALVLLALARRRIALVALAACTSACTNDDIDAEDSTSTSENSSTTTTVSPSTSTTTVADSSSEGDPCPLGTDGCACSPDLACNLDLVCVLQICRPCPTGTLGCACGDAYACDEGLVCAHDQCATFIPCGFADNGECDEPEGTGLCLEGSDPTDCSASESSTTQ